VEKMSMNSNSPMRIAYDLEEISAQLFARFPVATELFLFGSRRHRTRSERSDVDLLLKHEGYLKASEVREFIDEVCPALDVFLVDGFKAVSVVNDSYVESSDFFSLLEVLSAVKVWDREAGKADADVDWEMIVRADVVFTKTVLPGILLRPEDLFLDMELVNNTRDYIEKIADQINRSYTTNILDGCAVLCRRLAEILIIEVYEAKGTSACIKENGNYMMLGDLINIIKAEEAFNIGRNAKKALDQIKHTGDRSAHGRDFTARYSDVNQLRLDLRDVVEALVRTSGIQRTATHL